MRVVVVTTIFPSAAVAGVLEEALQAVGVCVRAPSRAA
jgi:hypothetical protein